MENHECYGSSYHTVDSKGRLFLTEEYRNMLGEGFVLSLSNDLKTMAFYSEESWAKKSAMLRSVPETDRIAHKLLRLVFGSTFIGITPDSQGRVLLPQTVRDTLKLNECKEVVLSGTGNSLEIWNLNEYNKEFGAVDQKQKDDLLDYVNKSFTNAGGNI